MARPTCATCAAFKPSARDDDKEHGACRRRAPFVSVFVDDWCLEHVPQADAEPAPFTPFTGPVLQCECASCKAERTPSAPPPPEPDPQGL